jgi:hypothetical protein
LPVFEETTAQQWGLGFENAIAELAERETGKKILDREKFFEKDGMTAHVDGIFEDGVMYEAKTTTSFMFRDSWGEPGTDRIPQYYQAQVQWNMNLAGLNETRVFVLTWPETPDAWEKMGWRVEPIEAAETVVGYRLIKYTAGSDKKCCFDCGVGLSCTTACDVWKKRISVKSAPQRCPPEKMCTYNCIHYKKEFSANFHNIYDPKQWADIFKACGYFHQYPVKANPEAQRMMAEAYREFWHKHVLTGIPPEPRNYDDIKRMFVDPVGTIVCDAAMTAWWREYDAIRKENGQSGNAAKRQAKLKLRILNQASKICNPESRGLLAKAMEIKAVLDDESQEKVIFRDSSGNKLGQYSLKGGFR